MSEKFSFRIWRPNTIAFNAELLRIQRETVSPLSKSDCINIYINETLTLLKQSRGEDLETAETTPAETKTLLEKACAAGNPALEEYFTCPKDALKKAIKLVNLPCLEDDAFQCGNEECLKALREKLQ